MSTPRRRPRAGLSVVALAVLSQCAPVLRRDASVEPGDTMVSSDAPPGPDAGSDVPADQSAPVDANDSMNPAVDATPPDALVPSDGPAPVDVVDVVDVVEVVDVLDRVDASRDVLVDSAPDLVTVDVPRDVPAEMGVDAGLDATPDVINDASNDAAESGAGDASTRVPFAGPCRTSAECAGPSGESVSCAEEFGTPLCIQTCNALPDFALCAGEQGVCVPQGAGRKVCLPKCGDAENRRCGPGAACTFLGARDRRASGAGFVPVGICEPSCAESGADACRSSTRRCDTATRDCVVPGCAGGCPSGSSCDGIACVPTTPTPLYGACTARASASSPSSGCLGELCLGVGGMTGFCSGYCNTDDSATACGVGGVCWTDLSALDTNTPGGTLGASNGSFGVLGGRTSGICLRACTDTSECPAGFHCGASNGVRACIPRPIPRGGPATPPGSAQPGSVCRTNADCASSRCARATGYADGLCQRATMGSTCPTGTLPTMDGFTCVPACTGMAALECPASLACFTNVNACQLGVCRDDADCESPYRCDHRSSRCVASVTPGTLSGVGEGCTANEQCAGGACLPQRTVGTTVQWQGGYCTAQCVVLPDLTDTCPSGAFCNAPGPGIAGVCLDLCDAATGMSRFGACRMGYVCDPFDRDPRVGLCVPP